MLSRTSLCLPPGPKNQEVKRFQPNPNNCLLHVLIYNGEVPPIVNFLVPEQIETERLVLRQFKDQDWRDLHEYYSDVEATKYSVGRPLTEADTWRTMCTMIGHWQLRRYGPYAAENKDTGKVIGPIGFWYPNDWPGPEIKWALAPKYWGMGFAREAALAIQEAGRLYLPDISLISLIHHLNTPSIKLAVSIGAELDSKISFRNDTFNIYRHPQKVA